jgi:hypothetical protein
MTGSKEAQQFTNPKMAKGIYLDDLGSNLHTALRKLCDSAPTSAAWNLINLLPGTIWGAYLGALKKQLPESENITDTVKEVSCELKYQVDYRSLKEQEPEAGSWINLFSCVFRTFSVDDWGSYTCWLTEE